MMTHRCIVTGNTECIKKLDLTKMYSIGASLSQCITDMVHLGC